MYVLTYKSLICSQTFLLVTYYLQVQKYIKWCNMQGFLAIVKQQEFAQPKAIHEKVQESLSKIKKDLPLIHQSMALYLANGDTQFVLYRPIKVRYINKNKLPKHN